MKHWTEFLPEAGRQAQTMGRQQTYKAEGIAQTLRTLKQQQEEYAAEEARILEAIKLDWNDKEIKRAIKEMDLANM